MPLAICLTIAVLAAAPTDTLRSPATGPTIARAQVGMVVPPLIRDMPRLVQRRLSGQAEGGLIGAVVGAAISAGIVQAWQGHDEQEDSSLLLPTLGGAFAGFIIGVLIAGPS